jgi:hypothetical protein
VYNKYIFSEERMKIAQACGETMFAVSICPAPSCNVGANPDLSSGIGYVRFATTRLQAFHYLDIFTLPNFLHASDQMIYDRVSRKVLSGFYRVKIPWHFLRIRRKDVFPLRTATRL